MGDSQISSHKHNAKANLNAYKQLSIIIINVKYVISIFDTLIFFNKHYVVTQRWAMSTKAELT